MFPVDVFAPEDRGAAVCPSVGGAPRRSGTFCGVPGRGRFCVLLWSEVFLRRETAVKSVLVCDPFVYEDWSGRCLNTFWKDLCPHGE